MSEIELNLEDIDLRDLYGQHNSKLNLVKNAFPDVQIISRGSRLKISGEKKEAQKAKSKLETLVRILKMDQDLPLNTVKKVLSGSNIFLEEGGKKKNVIVFGRGGKPIKARTRNQKRIVEEVERNDILFAVGPAGTGKTYTAVALAVRALKNRLVQKIILTRPAVEAGESLGFLPGDLKEKIDPYLRPLYDALDDMFTPEKLNQFIANRTIEVAPLAYMRGRTLDNAFIILDEAQNCTSGQLKMFLTRLGPSAKCIITGDLSQIDLPRSQKSGLKYVLNTLAHLDGISKVYLDAEDVVRHALVKDIILAFKRKEDKSYKQEEE